MKVYLQPIISVAGLHPDDVIPFYFSCKELQSWLDNDEIIVFLKNVWKIGGPCQKFGDIIGWFDCKYPTMRSFKYLSPPIVCHMALAGDRCDVYAKSFRASISSGVVYDESDVMKHISMCSTYTVKHNNSKLETELENVFHSMGLKRNIRALKWAILIDSIGAKNMRMFSSHIYIVRDEDLDEILYRCVSQGNVSMLKIVHDIIVSRGLMYLLSNQSLVRCARDAASLEILQEMSSYNMRLNNDDLNQILHRSIVNDRSDISMHILNAKDDISLPYSYPDYMYQWNHRVSVGTIKVLLSLWRLEEALHAAVYHGYHEIVDEILTTRRKYISNDLLLSCAHRYYSMYNKYERDILMVRVFEMNFIQRWLPPIQEPKTSLYGLLESMVFLEDYPTLNILRLEDLIVCISIAAAMVKIEVVSFIIHKLDIMMEHTRTIVIPSRSLLVINVPVIQNMLMSNNLSVECAA